MKMLLYYKPFGERRVFNDVYSINRDYQDKKVIIEYVDITGLARVEELDTEIIGVMEVVV